MIAVFVSTHETLRAERAIKNRKIRIRSILKPRHISSNCQLALEFADNELSKVAEAVADENLELVGYYQKGENGDWVEAVSSEDAL